jgi:hypothetical protein
MAVEDNLGLRPTLFFALSFSFCHLELGPGQAR